MNGFNFDISPIGLTHLTRSLRPVSVDVFVKRFISVNFHVFFLIWRNIYKKREGVCSYMGGGGGGG
jgi:hypothetical protein